MRLPRNPDPLPDPQILSPELMNRWKPQWCHQTSAGQDTQVYIIKNKFAQWNFITIKHGGAESRGKQAQYSLSLPADQAWLLGRRSWFWGAGHTGGAIPAFVELTYALLGSREGSRE